MRNYVLILLIGIPAVLGIIAISNFMIDPGNIYLNKIFNREVVDKYTAVMVDSEFGVVQEGWNEREVKLSLAKRNNRGACLVLGSSQIMTVSILRGGSINSNCKQLVNLGVSGASIEDLAIFGETIIRNSLDADGTKLYIAISPWLYNFDKDARYVPYRDIYRDFLIRVGSKVEVSASQEQEYFLSWLSNLISSDYFSQVVKLVIKDGLKHQFSKTTKVLAALQSPDEYVESFLMPEFNFLQGAEVAVTLKDGSHVYPKEYINGQREFGGGGYRLDPIQWTDAKAIGLFEDILKQFQKQNFEVILLLTPYHHDVWEKTSGELARNIMINNSRITHELASKLNIKILGSYNPLNIGCRRDEFHDFMHPTPGCMSKVFQTISSNTF